MSRPSRKRPYGPTISRMSLASTCQQLELHVDVARICNIPPNTRGFTIGQSLSYAPRPSSPFSSSSLLPLSCEHRSPDPSMQAIINRVAPDTVVENVKVLYSLRCQRLYDVRVSDGSHLVVALPPPPMTKLLRSEQGSISCEAAVLTWLAAPATNRDQLATSETQKQTQTQTQDARHGDGEKTERVVPQQQPSDESNDRQLAKFVPKLLASTSSSRDLALECNMMQPTSGSTISELQTAPLTLSERAQVDFQTGQFSRKLCSLTSPTGRFGPAFAVLPSSYSSSSQQQTSRPASGSKRNSGHRVVEYGGVRSWSTAFYAMLEAVLRDGEDMAVMLGYSTIRGHFQRLAPVLDGVVTSRLVAVDMGDDHNTIVLRNPAGQTTSPTRSQAKRARGEGEGRDTGKEGEQSTAPETPKDILVTGMRDWSNFIFGDPLFATIFSQNPAREFLRGFHDIAETHTGEISISGQGTPSSLIDDESSAAVRLLLYDCYHTITQIVREFYRPQQDSSQRELVARKKLNIVLGKLAEIEM